MGEGKPIMRTSTGRRTSPAGQTASHRSQPAIHTARRVKGAVRILSALCSVLLATAALAACAPSQATVKAPTATVPTSATAAPSAAPRLVYQADWSHGLNGWAATPGWTLSGGVLRSDMGRDRTLTSPYRATTSNYAVEFRIQLVSVSTTAATEYSVSADAAPGADGYMALFDHVALHQCMFACHPHEAVYIDPMVDQDVGTGTVQIHDFEPGIHLLTYRLEVRGPEVTLLIDGHRASWALGTKTPQLATGPIHFYSTGVALQLSDFKVYAL